MAVLRSTQHLINDGFDIQTGHDPYRNFVYTSFQELATNISHRRVATLAKKTGNNRLAKMCAIIAADEARHANAYIDFVKRIFERLDFLLPLAPLVHFGAFVQFVNYARLSETVED